MDQAQPIENMASSIPLTMRQREVLRFIHIESQARGYAPSVREIGAFIGGVSTNAVMDYLARLESKGCILRVAKHARSLRVTAHGLMELGAEPVDAPSHEPGLVEQANMRMRQLLLRTSKLLSELAPRSPLLAEVRKELGA